MGQRTGCAWVWCLGRSRKESWWMVLMAASGVWCWVGKGCASDFSGSHERLAGISCGPHLNGGVHCGLIQMLHKRTNQEVGIPAAGPGERLPVGVARWQISGMGTLERVSSRHLLLSRMHKASDQRTVPLLSWPILPLCGWLGLVWVTRE